LMAIPSVKEYSRVHRLPMNGDAAPGVPLFFVSVSPRTTDGLTVG